MKKKIINIAMFAIACTGATFTACTSPRSRIIDSDVELERKRMLLDSIQMERRVKQLQYEQKIKQFKTEIPADETSANSYEFNN